MTNLDSILKSRDIINKVPSSQSYDFSSSPVWIWELDHKESWALKNWYFWTVVLDKTLESPLDCNEIKPVNPKGNQSWMSWIFIGRTDAKALKLLPPDMKNWLIGKDPDAGKDWSQEENGMTEDEMVGWDYRPDGHEFEQVLGVSGGQGSLECFSPWGHKESDMTERLNWVISTKRFKGYKISLITLKTSALDAIIFRKGAFCLSWVLLEERAESYCSGYDCT